LSRSTRSKRLRTLRLINKLLDDLKLGCWDIIQLFFGICL
jgi:hypothetical protein